MFSELKNSLILTRLLLISLSVLFMWSFSMMEIPRIGIFFNASILLSLGITYFLWAGSKFGALASEEMEDYRSKVILTFIMVVAIVLRFSWVEFMVVTQTSDFKYYSEMAEQIYNGNYLISASKQSGPGLLGAGLYKLQGEINIQSFLFLQAFLSSITVAIVFFIIKELFNNKAALIGTFFMAINPEAWVYTNVFGNEPSMVFFFTLSVLCVQRSLASSTSSKFASFVLIALAGVLLGFAQYMRATGFIIILAFISYLFVFARFDIRKLITMFAFFSIITSPILHFNYNNFKTFSFSPNQYSGFSLLIGTKKETLGRYYGEFMDEVEQEINRRENLGELNLQSIVTSMSESTGVSREDANSYIKNQIAMEMGKERLLENGIDLFKIALTFKIPLFYAGVNGYSWSIDTSDLLPNQAKELLSLNLERLTRVLQYVMILSGAATLFALGISGWKRDLDLLGMLAFTTLVLGLLHGIVEIQPKYHYSILTVFPIFAFGFLKDAPQVKNRIKFTRYLRKKYF